MHETCNLEKKSIFSKFSPLSDCPYLESAAHVCLNRNSAEDDKNWHYNSNLLPILDELVAILVEFGFANVIRLETTPDREIQRKTLEISEIPFENSKEFRTKRLVVRDFWKKG